MLNLPGLVKQNQSILSKVNFLFANKLDSPFINADYTHHAGDYQGYIFKDLRKIGTSFHRRDYSR